MIFLDKIKKAFVDYTVENFIDAFFESVLISLIVTFILWLKEFLFFKHKLIPINSSTLDIKEVPATSYSIGSKARGFETEFSLRIQNIGNKTAEELTIIYMLDHSKPLSHGTKGCDKTMQHIFPGNIGDFIYKQVLNFNNIEYVGTTTITIKTLLICKNGAMTSFDIIIFKNFTHESVQSIGILNIQTQNKFKSFILRKLIKYNNKKVSTNVFNFIGIKDEFIEGYKLLKNIE
jgi:hypothetical protein